MNQHMLKELEMQEAELLKQLTTTKERQEKAEEDLDDFKSIRLGQYNCDMSRGNIDDSRINMSFHDPKNQESPKS